MRRWPLCTVLVLLTGLVYLNSFPGAFHFDDFDLILRSPEVGGERFRLASFIDHYGGRPLTLWSFHWNQFWFGSEPGSFHAVNVLLHAVVIVLFFLFLWERTQPALAVLAALIFAIHPLQTQPVNYIWSRSMLLMTLFALLTLHLWRHHRWWALAALQLAIWSRAEALILVPLLAWRRPARWKPLVALGGLNLAGFVVGFLRINPREVGLNHSDMVDYWLAQPAAFWHYLRLMVWPAGQTIDHTFMQPSWPIVTLSALLLVGWLVTAWRLRKSTPVLSWALLSLPVCFLPSALFPNTIILNESRAYAAMGGFSVAVAWVAVRCGVARRGRPWAQLVLGGVLLTWSGLTLSRNHLWNNDIALWQEAVGLNPGQLRAHYNLGFALAQQGQVEEAQESFQKALSLNPQDDLSYAALGYCAEFKGDWNGAGHLYRSALQLNPSNQYAAAGLERVLSAQTKPQLLRSGQDER